MQGSAPGPRDGAAWEGGVALVCEHGTDVHKGRAAQRARPTHLSGRGCVGEVDARDEGPVGECDEGRLGVEALIYGKREA